MITRMDVWRGLEQSVIWSHSVPSHARHPYAASLHQRRELSSVSMCYRSSHHDRKIPGPFSPWTCPRTSSVTLRRKSNVSAPVQNVFVDAAGAYDTNILGILGRN